MSDKKLVVAIFDNEAAADSAVASLQQRDKADKSVDMNAVGVLVLDDNGNLKTHKMGHRSIAKGAGIGAMLALFTPVGLAVGVAGGGLLGALHRKGLKMEKDYRDMVIAELLDGKAAVGVLARPDDADQIMAWMEDLGGRPETHTVSEAAISEAVKQAEAPETA